VTPKGGVGRRTLLVLVTGLQATGKSTVADAAGELLAAPVLSHDWTMSGLRTYPEVQRALDAMDPSGHSSVGWSILFALARQQLRRGTSVVLDGVARAAQVHQCRNVSREERAQMLLIVTQCRDLDVHRARVEGRQRHIPNWYELDWDHVEQARSTWVPPEAPHLLVDSCDPWSTNLERLRLVLPGTRRTFEWGSPSGHGPA
jgi:predicted kinase